MPGLGKSGTSRMSVLRSGIRGNARIVTRGGEGFKRRAGKTARWRSLVQVVQPVIVPIESLFVDLRDVQQTRDALHDFAQAAVPLAVLHGNQLYGLRERFVPPGQPLQSLVDRKSTRLNSSHLGI